MKYEADSPEQYISQIPEEKQAQFLRLRKTIKANLPKGFEEIMNYGMIGYVVPHSAYPSGYHVNPKLPLPFINIASQKKFIALYHMAIYAHKELLEWFIQEYPKHSKTKLDMGKSCIRFKKANDIPYELLGELFKKISMEEWIKIYETSLNK